MTQRASFFEKLQTRIDTCNSHLCIGIDPHLQELFPNGTNTIPLDEEDRCDAAFTFCKTIIESTAPHAAAFKPNAAFFEALGPNLGAATLRRVIAAIPNDIPVLLDAKRGDIGSTAAAYAKSAYEHWNADGVTLSPLMGWDSVKPFVTGTYSSKGAFLLCKTSNPGSNDLLALHLNTNNTTGETLYERIASLTTTWSQHAANDDHTEENNEDKNNATKSSPPPPRLGLVVGATDPIALQKARTACGPDTWILAPGVGAQGGDLHATCKAGMNSNGTKLLIPVSRAISRSPNPCQMANDLKDQINAAREEICSSLETTTTTTNDSEVVKEYQKRFIELSLSLGVLKFGSFVLKSGRTSPYFFNAGLFATGGALFRLGKAYAAAIMSFKEFNSNGNINFDVVFGPAYKGISLGALVCASLYNDFGIDVGFAYNRKESKQHGEGGVLVGASMNQQRILIVDDVITAGTAIRESSQLLRDNNATPVGVVIALDRAEKRSLDDPVSAVQAVERDLSIPVVSIVSLPQLQLFLTNSDEFGEDVLKSVEDYQARYGV